MAKRLSEYAYLSIDFKSFEVFQKEKPKELYLNRTVTFTWILACC